MNQNILRKAIDILKDEANDTLANRVTYVLGMLETLAELTSPIAPVGSPIKLATAVATEAAPTDETSILDAKARAAIEQVKSMSKTSTE